MRFIQKIEPDFFEEDVKDLREQLINSVSSQKNTFWNKYTKKKELKKHILENEQFYLCGYCESKVDLNNSHIEHIEPKSNNYDKLTFNYSNLLVSCNGQCTLGKDNQETCGHKKDNNFNEKLFLNPNIKKNIRDNFKYTNIGEITVSHKKNKKAKYTIDLLNLNSIESNLAEKRLIANRSFRKSVIKHSEKTGGDIKSISLKLLEQKNIPFISFLLFQYKLVS